MTNVTDAKIAILNEKIDKLEEDKKALSETMDSLPKINAQQLELLNFVGTWEFVDFSGNRREYYEHFGFGFLLCLSIDSFGKIIILIFLPILYLLEFDGKYCTKADVDGSVHRFEVGKEFEWGNRNGQKYKVIVSEMFYYLKYLGSI